MKIGDRVSYKEGDRSCTGVITQMYPAYLDEPAYCDVKVDSLPEWWPYHGTYRFSPEQSKLTRT